MPTYEYQCPLHGRFDLYRPMSESGCAGVCPACGMESARTITVPNLQLMSPTLRSAMSRNEKSRHAPQVCGSACGHQHTTKKKASAAAGGNPALTPYTGPRPWVIEHR